MTKIALDCKPSKFEYYDRTNAPVAYSSFTVTSSCDEKSIVTRAD